MKDPKNKDQARRIKEMAPLYENHAFWDTQPVLHLKEQKVAPKDGPIESKEIKDVRPTPLPLPEGFEWAEVDLSSDKDMNEVHKRLFESNIGL